MRIGMLVVGLVLAISPFGFLSTSADTGHAAYYDAGYSASDWYSICQRHVGWGDSIGSCYWSDYWCVEPGMLPGESLYLEANGSGLTCEIGDTIQPGDLGNWEANWVVELSWDTFVALGLQSNNWVEVGGSSAPQPPDPSPPDPPDPPDPAPPAPPTSQYFEATGHTVQGGFYQFWVDNGGLAIFGYPETDEFTDTRTGLTMQYFERARFEWQDGQVILGRVGAEQLGK
jgi:hypothetical protein